MGDRKMGHVQSFGTYLGVFIALLILTVVTYWVSKLDFGTLGNELVAMGVAGLKASLVVLFFMHGKYEGKDTWAFILYPFILLVILLGGLFLDYKTRGEGTIFEIKEAKIMQPLDAGDHGSNDGHGADGHGADGHSHDGGDAGHGHDGADAGHSHDGGDVHSHDGGDDHSHDSGDKKDH